jgi:hypothetical protein
VVKKQNEQPSNSIAEKTISDNFKPSNSAVEQELKARHIVSTMTEFAKVRDMRNRRQLAENLGRILSKRKDQLNLTDLVVDAGISKNPDPSRLGRFRILPGKKVDQSSLRRLSQDALAYVRLVKETAKVTGEDSSTLIEELVLGTRFDPSGLEGIEIEPFEQLQSLIQKKIDVLNAKFDLNTYFQTIRQNGLLPLWSQGPIFNKRISSHHSAENPQIIGWGKVLRPNDQDDWRDQVMPCVPLCRIRSPRRESFPVSLKCGEILDENASLHLYLRIFLGIGMFEREYFDPEYFDEMIIKKDSSPRPYLILTEEFHYWPGNRYMFSGPPNLRGIIAGGVCLDTNVPYIFYDESSNLEIRSLGEPFELEPAPGTDRPRWRGLPFSSFESSYPLDLSLFREVFGKSLISDEDISNNSREIKFMGKDALNINSRSMTLAPHNTIAELMETNLISSPVQETDVNSETNLTFLDKLEIDAERMTSSLQAWIDNSRSDLKKKHKSLIEKFEREYEATKNKI